MQEHEQALIDAIARLADLSDGESGNSQFACLIAVLSEICPFTSSLLIRN